MNTEESMERSWAEIDLDALTDNFCQIRELLHPETKVLAVVKANAYGHGAVACAQTLLAAGADYLGVATLEEALQLRRAAISAPILILGYAAECEAECLVREDITPAVYSLSFAKALSAEAVRQNKRARIHLKVNTGMERIGFDVSDVQAMLTVSCLPNLYTEGIFTHLACADEADSSGVHTQFKRFTDVIDALDAEGIHIPLQHILNSAGIFDFPEYQLTMVRPGIILYGYYPSAYIHRERAVLKPVMSVKSRVIHIHSVPKGAGISYGWTFVAPRNMRVATVPIGYADGYKRGLSSKVFMLADGQRVPVLGKICMDQCMIDIGSVHTIHVGDTVTVLGQENGATVTADDLAELCQTISYEILCTIGARIPRLYVKDGRMLSREATGKF